MKGESRQRGGDGTIDHRTAAIVRRSKAAGKHMRLTDPMRRSIDDYPFDPADYPPHYEDDELTAISWAVAISDDYDDAEPRVVLTVEEVGRAGAGLVAHLSPTIARRLRVAVRDALAEIGEDAGP
jgi:hypothetical protein